MDQVAQGDEAVHMADKIPPTPQSLDLDGGERNRIEVAATKCNEHARKDLTCSRGRGKSA